MAKYTIQIIPASDIAVGDKISLEVLPSPQFEVLSLDDWHNSFGQLFKMSSFLDCNTGEVKKYHTHAITQSFVIKYLN
jgi:hypothetical protein